jgi:pimeloyl-ACP methyl ester carboxylesterase
MPTSLREIIRLAQIALPQALDPAGIGPAIDPRVAEALLRELDGTIERSPAARRVYVLPGTLATELTRKSDGRKVWIDPEHLTLGRGVSDLSMTPGQLGPPLEAGAPLAPVYGPIQTYLSLYGWDVVPWGYDWRGGVDDAAHLFAAVLANEPQPVHLVTHSMGGLIVRRAVQMHPELMADPDRKIERAVLIAPPFHGTLFGLQIVRGSFWGSPLMAAVGYGAGEIKRICCDLPGFAELLADPALFPWTRAIAQGDGGFSDAMLQHAADFGDALRNPTGDAAVADQALLARSSIVLCTTRPTAVAVDTEGTFTWANAGDDCLPAASARVEGVAGYFGSTWTHSFLPTDPAVWRGVRAILEGNGADAAFFLGDPAPSGGPTDAPSLLPADMTTLVYGEIMRQILANAPAPSKAG